MTSSDSGARSRRGPNELWIDQTPPHRFRALLNDLPDPGADPRALVCATGIPVGGRRHARRHPGADARVRAAEQAARLADEVPHATAGPRRSLRQAIATEARTDEGKAQVDGRTVERIRIDPRHQSDLPCVPSRLSAEANVRVRRPRDLLSGRSTFSYAVGLVNGPVLWHDLVVRYDTYEFLPRTDANLALTDIRAQHPDATGP